MYRSNTNKLIRYQTSIGDINVVANDLVALKQLPIVGHEFNHPESFSKEKLTK